MRRDITPAGRPATGLWTSVYESAGELRSVLPCGRDRGARHDDGGGSDGGLRTGSGVDGREVTIPSWQNRGAGALARSLGDGFDADQRIEAPIRPRYPAARG